MHKETAPITPVQAELEQPEQVEYKKLAGDELRREYITFTERLIASTLEKNIDTMIFLDKSARPIAWMVRSLWPTLGFKEFNENGDAVIEKMPDMKFLNIDREQWHLMMGRSEGRDGAGITLDQVPKDTIDSLTGLYSERSVGPREYIDKDEPTFLDDKNVLIVDEVKASGDTLTIAQALIGKGFNHTKSISGTHWMPPKTVYDKKTGGRRNADIPVWYDSSTPYGRLVDERNSIRSMGSPSLRQQRGSQFLSTRFENPDEQGIQLRKEVKQLGKEVSQGLYPIAPSADRNPSKDFKEEFIRHTSGLSIEEFAALRQQATKENVSFTELFREYKQDKETQ